METELTVDEKQELIRLRHREKQLEAELFQLKTIINKLPINVYWMDTHGVYQGCNEAVISLFNLESPQQFIGKTIFELDPQNASNISSIDKAVMQSNTPKILEEVGVTKNGVEAIYWTCKAPLHNQQNEVIGLIGASINITERIVKEKQAQRDKENAETKRYLIDTYLDNILASIPQHLYWVDRNGVVLGCNDQQARSFGFASKEDLIGKTIYDVADILGWDRSVADRVRENDFKIMLTGEKQVFEETAELDGEIKTFLSYKNPLVTRSGEIIGVFGLTVDITDRKRMEKELQKSIAIAEQASQTKTDFLMNMSHDIRTPLNGIFGYSQILHMQETDPIKKDNLGNILKSAQRLINLLNEIIDIAYIEKGLPINKTSFNINQLAEEINDLLQTKIQEKNLQFIIEISEEVPRTITSDKLRIHRILLNVIGNAIKFTKHGYVKLTIGIERETDLSLHIEDTGIGIPADKIQLIFDKFTRLSPSNQGIYQGTGLGLSIVKQFVNDLNGTISIASEINVGTHVYLNIPLL